MKYPSLAKIRRQVDRAIELSPQLIRHPSHISAGLKGIHISILGTLGKPWLRSLEFDVILDVGANTGQFARAAHLVFPNARIYSFEPLPSCLSEMQSHMKGIANFRSFVSAVGSEDGHITIHQSSSSPSSSIFPMTVEHTSAFPWTEGGKDVEVEIHRLDFFLPQMDLSGKVLLKIDVQGFSQQVLLGAPETLKQADTVFIETSFVQLYDGEPTFDETYSFMRDAGFEFIGFLDQLQHPKTGQILQGDAIFQRPELCSVVER